MGPEPPQLNSIAGLAPGVFSQAPADGATLAGELAIVPGQLIYMHIPASELRGFVDGVFPALAKNGFADTASGYGHRYQAGHDLLLDVPRTALTEGPFEGLKHAGHIVLTDFPTKAGIPLPGFSDSGLGHLLGQAGISSGWVQLSAFDTGIGIFALTDGLSELSSAMQGLLLMDFDTACQTFGTGAVEIGFAVATQNPLLMAGGLSNVAAGLVSTWQTFSVYVDPLALLGSAGVSALLGLGVAYALVDASLSEAAKISVRSGVVGGLYAISTAFGIGAFFGFVAARAGAALADVHNASAAMCLKVDRVSHDLLMRELCDGNDEVEAILAASRPILLEAPPWELFSPVRNDPLESDMSTLSTHALDRLNDRVRTLDVPVIRLSDNPLRLRNDPAKLSEIYDAVLWRTR